MELGEKIAGLRKAKGMTQAELGEKLSVTFQAVSKWERGESYPDFETVSRLAKVFGVPLAYFEEGEEAESHEEETEEAEKEAPEMLGVCRTCGRVVYETTVAETTPALLCKDCKAQATAAADKAKREAEEKKRAALRQAEAARQAARHTAAAKRKKGFIWAGVIGGLYLVLIIIGLALDPQDAGMVIGGMLFNELFLFTFVAQMIWGGTVKNVAGAGGAIIGTPGVIFTLDLDGLFFLVGVKLLFAVLRFVIYLLTRAVTIAAAVIISPVCFVPRLLELNRAVHR